MFREFPVLLLIGLLGKSDGTDMVRGDKTIIWVNHSPQENKAHAFLFRGDPAVWLPEFISTGNSENYASFTLSRKLSNNDFERAGADFWEDAMIVSNSKGNYIERLPTYFRPTDNIVAYKNAGTRGEPQAIAVDWVNKHVYWTDAQLNIIGMASYKTFGRQRIVHASVDTPMAIAVNPLEGYLYWSTRGSNVQIRRSNMLGTDIPSSIVTQRSTVTAMIVDYKNGALYYVENYLRVYTCDKDGQRERVLSGVWGEAEGYTIADIGLFENYLFVTAKEKMFFDVYNKETSESLKRINGADVFGRTPTAITVSAPERQPNLTGTVNGCDQSNGQCSQFCVQHGLSGHSCACDFGFTLQSDGRTCLPPTPVVSDNFLLVCDSLHRDIFQIDLTNSARDQADKAHALPLGDILEPVAITYDASNILIYWTNTKEKSIHEATLEGSGQRKILELVAATGVDIQRLALRETPRRVYFTAGRSIEWISPESGDRGSIFNADPLQNTRGLALDHRTNTMYWSECGVFDVIYSADVDTLNNKRTLMDFRGGRVVCPYDIALDLIDNNIYWVDGSSDYTHAVVERADMDGTNREVIYDVSTATALLYGLTLDSRLVYVTDRHSRTVITIDKVSRAVSSIGYPFHGIVNGVYLHNSTYSAQAAASPTPTQSPNSTVTLSPSLPSRPSPTLILEHTSTEHAEAGVGPDSTKPTFVSSSSGSISTAILGGAVSGGIVLVVLIITVTIGIVVCVRSRSSRRRPTQVNPPVVMALANPAYIAEASAAPVSTHGEKTMMRDTYLTTVSDPGPYQALGASQWGAAPPTPPPRYDNSRTYQTIDSAVFENKYS